MRFVFFKGGVTPDELLLKATVLREITIPAYTRHDGVFVPEHRKMVHVNDEISKDDIRAGRGSHSQREAHRRLSQLPGWNDLPPVHQLSHILSHATGIQNRRSAAAAVSGWRSRARAGQNPTPGQWQAFYQLSREQQAAELSHVPEGARLSAPARENVPQEAPAAPVANARTTSFGDDNAGHVLAAGGFRFMFDRQSSEWMWQVPSGAWEPVQNEALIPHLNSGTDASGNPLVPAHAETDLDRDRARRAARSEAIRTAGEKFEQIGFVRQGDRPIWAYRQSGDGNESASVRVRISARDDSAMLDFVVTRSGSFNSTLGGNALPDVEIGRFDSGPEARAAATEEVQRIRRASKQAQSVRVNDMTMDRRADGSWLSRGGVVHGPGSAIWIAAEMLSGHQFSPDEVRPLTQGARLGAVELMARAGRSATEMLDKLMPADDADGVREGDTKMVGGVTYVLRGGRWHRQDQAAPAPVAARPADVLVSLNGDQFRRTAGGGWETMGGSPVRNVHYIESLNRLHERGQAPASSEPRLVLPRRRSAQESPVVTAPPAAVVLPSDASVNYVDVFRAVAIPNVDHWSGSETNVRTRARLAQLAELASSGNYEGVVNFSTTRSRSNYIVVDDYRSALLRAADAASTTPQQVAQAMASPVPDAPVVNGPDHNSVVIGMRRRVRELRAAADMENPVAAILAINTSMSNSYNRIAHRYKIDLLRHFGYGLDGTPLSETVPGAPEPAPVPAPRVRSVRRRTTPTAPVAVPPSQNPEIAANRFGLSESDLGFVPRPNVPFTISTNRLPAGYRWPHPEMAELNRRYLAQSGTLQNRAREYQAGSWVPDTPEVRAARKVAEAERRSREEAEALERRRREQEEERRALVEIERRRASTPDLYKPRSELGANITEMDVRAGAVGVAKKVFGITTNTELENFAKTIVADFGAGVTFRCSVSKSSDSLYVEFRGSDGTYIQRDFYKSGNDVIAHHGYFENRGGENSTSGNGSGKDLFRTSMGLYHAYGVTHVKTQANIDVGNYAWARFGYVPDSLSSIKSKIEHRLNALVAGTGRAEMSAARGGIKRFDRLPEKIAARVRELLQATDKKLIWRIADMKYNGRSIGKELLLGYGQGWYGTMHLKDAETMSRFNAYVSSERG